MAYYNRRDLFSHWVRKDEPANRPCQHACCRGMRAHPEGYPVVKRRAYYRHVSDEELFATFGRHSAETPRDEKIRAQVLAEAQRRDVASERRTAAAERRRGRVIERSAENERVFAEAETATIGYMLNQRGREAGVDPRSLFAGQSSQAEARRRKYASDELLDYFEHNPWAIRGRERRRSTEQEQYERDQYDAAQYNIERGAAA